MTTKRMERRLTPPSLISSNADRITMKTGGKSALFMATTIKQIHTGNCPQDKMAGDVHQLPKENVMIGTRNIRT